MSNKGEGEKRRRSDIRHVTDSECIRTLRRRDARRHVYKMPCTTSTLREEREPGIG